MRREGELKILNAGEGIMNLCRKNVEQGIDCYDITTTVLLRGWSIVMGIIFQ